MGEACSNNITAYQPDLVLAQRPSDSFGWYALKVRTRSEQVTMAVLQSRGFDPYCPTRQERRRYSDRMKVVNTPLFPGYVFCRFDIQEKVPVISSPGVEYIVGSGGKPVAISDSDLKNVRRV